MTDNSPRRSDDIAIAELVVQFKDFIERYERDWEHTQEWREAHWKVIDDNSKILNEIAPNYRRGILVVSTIVLGTVAYAVKSLLNHFKWQ